MNNDLWFVYDGECPICSLGASMYRLRQSVGALHTVDARTEPDHPVMREVNAAGLNLDEGMAIKFQGRLYQGTEALHLMAMLGADEGFLNRINNHLFKSERMARLCYPTLRAARNLALKIKGVGKINP